MSRDQTIGAVILLASVVGLVTYGYVLYFYAMLVLQVTAFVAVAVVLAILGKIGLTMTTTRPLLFENESRSPDVKRDTVKDPA
ncbi:MAG: transcriptional regulator [Candidatus Bathyarchaeia archaeon]|jgi:membrane protein implicated in regulation of membrane protease activity